MKTLKEIFAETGHFGKQDIGCNDKGGTHTYLETYDKLFEPFRDGCSIMEIGIALGHSIKMWDEYFEDSHITGVDISLMCAISPSSSNSVTLFEANATTPEFIEKIKYQTFDIIIDDGSHITNDQISTFEMLKGKMNKGSIYIIEDILALDIERERFLSLHKNVEIIDMRAVNGRFDNVLIIIKFD